MKYEIQLMLQHGGGAAAAQPDGGER